MKLLLIITIIITLIQVVRVSSNFLRKDVSSIKKIFELLILIVMVILEYFNLLDISKITMYLSLLLSIYILISFIYEKLCKNEYISVLSVKKGIDASDTGIMFLDDNNIILINNLFSDILKGLNITEDFVNNLIKRSFKKVNNNYLLKHNDKVYMLNIYDNKEVSLIDITELYSLQEEEKKQNKQIKENNDKLLLAIKNVEELEKENAQLRVQLEYYQSRKTSGRKKHNAKWMAIYNDFIVCYETGMTMLEIAKRNGVSERTIYRYKEEYEKMKGSGE